MKYYCIRRKHFFIFFWAIFLASFKYTQAQTFENIKQIYCDRNTGPIIYQLFSFNEYKYVVLQIEGIEGNIYYDDILLHPKSDSAGFAIILKLDKFNNYVKQIKTKSFHKKDKDFSPVNSKICVGEGLLWFIVGADDYYNRVIIAMDEEFREIIRIPTKNLRQPEIRIHNNNIYIESYLNDSGLTIISKDSFDLNGNSRFVIKYNLQEDRVQYISEIRTGPFAWAEPPLINAKGEITIAGSFGYFTNSKFAIQGDTLFTQSGGSDGYIYKLDTVGKLVYLNQISGDGTDVILHSVQDRFEDETYCSFATRGSSNSQYEGIDIICNPLLDLGGVLKINGKGEMLWQVDIYSDKGSFNYVEEYDEDYLIGYKSYADEVVLGDTSLIGMTNSNGVLFILNKKDGEVKLLKNIVNELENQIQSINRKAGDDFTTIIIGVYNNENGDIYLDSNILENNPKNYYRKGGMYIANLTDGNVNNANVLLKNQISVHPNPVFSCSPIFIEAEQKITKISIVDVHGKPVYNEEPQDVKVEILPNVKSGVYFLKVSGENSYKTFKLFIL